MRRIWSVAKVNRGLVRAADRLPSVWVRGDLSQISRNDRRATVFLTLKDPDDGSTLPVTMPRWKFDAVQPPPSLGASVILRGSPCVFERNAELSLRAYELELAGEGALLARIEHVRRRLAGEGLFDEERKQRLPFWPRIIGIVGGADAAAPLDIVANARHRFPAARFVLAETPVQGTAAAAGLIRALRRLDGEQDVDVIVVTRGGGSLEDLAAFSDEAVCRAIAACATPVVSAVGHERDTPLCDLVADVRASTPTAAARLLVPDREAELRNLEQLVAAARRCASRTVTGARLSLDALSARPALRRPGYWVDSRRAAIARSRAGLDTAASALAASRRTRVDALAARLRMVAPEATLSRGYAIVLVDGHAVTAAGELAEGDRVDLRLARGRAGARIEEVSEDG